MDSYGINIRCTEEEAESLAAEIRQEGYPAHWLMAMVTVTGFKDEIAIWSFTHKFGLHRRGKVPSLYQSKEII